jgi:hypothetical protein
MEIVSSDNGDGVCLVKACWGSKCERERRIYENHDMQGSDEGKVYRV